jgi:tripartite-type tricarboxylate transporter receptor subunit TctC
MDPKLVKTLHDAFKQAMEMPNHREALAKFDQELMYMDSARYTRFAADTFKKEKGLVEKLGLAKPS